MLAAQPFPYALPVGTIHLVYWVAYPSIDSVTEDIVNEVCCLRGRGDALSAAESFPPTER